MVFCFMERGHFGDWGDVEDVDVEGVDRTGGLQRKEVGLVGMNACFC